MSLRSAVLGVTCAVLALAVTAGPVHAAQAKRQKFEDSRLYFEYNATDQDIGIQISADAETWSALKLFDPHGNKLVDIFTKGAVCTLGLSELFSESDEPSLSDLSLDDFLSLYPEGTYIFVGVTPDGEKVTGNAKLTHILPAPPVITGPGAAPLDRNNVVVSWQTVPDPPGGKIITYEVIIEHGDNPVRTFEVDLPATATSVKIPPEYLQPGNQYSFEVQAWEAGSNHTFTVGTFSTL